MADKASPSAHPASFRDPSGFIFTGQNELYRQVNRAGAADYDQLIKSGLYQELAEAGQLVHHQEVSVPSPLEARRYKILQPETIPFISYPYEWSFGQLKAAALLTLDIQLRALKRGMSLKDASAYNIQFLGFQPIFIDTLSFETYQAGQIWPAYRQFCQHFLAPLALMSRVDLRLGQLDRDYLDGLPLDLTTRLLPKTARLNLGLYAHLYLHARSQKRYSATRPTETKRPLPLPNLLGLVSSLRTTVNKLKAPDQSTVWGDYYNDTNYSATARRHKEQLVTSWLRTLRPKIVHDLGANTGEFSRLAATTGALTIASDVDPIAVERGYQQAVRDQQKNLLPLLVDLTNPSPAIGWANEERLSFFERAKADVGLALALVHHLAIANNLPLEKIAETLSRLAPTLIIEFVPKTDSNAKRLLASRVDIFPNYTEAGFETAFGRYFTVQKKQKINGSQRTLYQLGRRRQSHER